MLGDSWTRGTHEVSDVLVADRDSQQRAPRIRDSKIGTQFQKCESDPLVETETQKAGAPQ
jgi:hypothetical protein